MRIWIVNPFDDLPEEGKPQRFWTLAQVLVDQGHEVVWWSSDWSHRRKGRRVAPENCSERSDKTGCGADPDRTTLNFERPTSNDVPSEATRPVSCEHVESDAKQTGTWSMASGELISGNPGTGHLSRRIEAKTEPSSNQQPTTTFQLPFQLRLVPTPAYSKNISFARIWNHRKFGRHLYQDACAAIDSGELAQPDVILASLPPMEGPMAALRLRKRYDCRVVTDVMDAWPETLLQALAAAKLQSVEVGTYRGSEPGELPHRSAVPPIRDQEGSLEEVDPGKHDTPSISQALLKRIGRVLLFPYYRMLRKACRESDAICAQSQTFADFARAHGATGEIHVCYLGADAVGTSNVQRPTSNDEMLSTESEDLREGDCPQSPVGLDSRNQGVEPPPSHTPDPLAHHTQRTANNEQPRKLRLLYIGSMGRSYDLETVVTACCKQLKEGRELELHFAGEGEKLERLKAMTADWPEGSVHFHGFLQEQALQDLLCLCDVGIISMFPESGVAVPYKVGDYLAAGLPVVNSLRGELQDLLESHDCGAFYQAGSVVSLESALGHYFDLSTAGLCEKRERAHALFKSRFDRGKTYPEFAKWLANG